MILKVFRDDLKMLSRRFFASAVIVAISILPALYAWVNIYANGNPYANTGEIKIALASYDTGIDLEDGTHVNMAEEVFDDVRDSDKIGWQFPGTPEDAIAGVRSGKYYAAVIFQDDFTYNMYNFEHALTDEDASLIYYENQKANAIAPKITETAANTLQESIKTKYLETVFGIVFDETGDLADRISDSDSVDTVLDQMKRLRDSLRDYESVIGSFTSKSSSIHSGIASAKKKISSTSKTAKKSAGNAASDLDTAKRSLKVLKAVLESREKSIEEKRAALEKVIEQLNGSGLTDEEKQQITDDASSRADALKSDLEGLLASFPESSESAAVQAIRSVLTSMISDVDAIKAALPDTETAEALLETLKELSQVSLVDAVDSLIDTIDDLIAIMEPLMSSMSTMISDLGPVLDSADGTITSLNISLTQMQEMFGATADRLDDIINRVEAYDGDDKIAALAKILNGDPEEYAKFFSALVDVEVEEIYSVASYGAAMSPFYTVLAIWVGGVISVAILKTHVDRKKYPGITETQAFFGRFLLFFVIGQAQAAVTVAGDIFLLGCAPVHPWLMWLTAAVTSLVFTLLIYALTLSFGDIGKAIVVVLMVVQIAGSSGSYPIEILPQTFGNVYKFFPFPYAINAMREALCGMYKLDMYRYLTELLIFGGIGLAIGLLVRKPFIGINKFVSEKLEETELL